MFDGVCSVVVEVKECRFLNLFCGYNPSFKLRVYAHFHMVEFVFLLSDVLFCYFPD